MRINCFITPDNRTALSDIITGVNTQRESMGLERVNQSEVINEIIARMAEKSLINLCGVFITNSRSNNKG